MPPSRPDTYHVAVKAFVTQNNEVLLCRSAADGEWDLPGGRIGVGEFDRPLEKILERELEEELGPSVRYRNRGPVALFRHRRPELAAAGTPEVRIFMIGFLLDYLGGGITLSEEHNEYRWVPMSEAPRLLTGGQRSGMERVLVILHNHTPPLAY